MINISPKPRRFFRRPKEEETLVGKQKEKRLRLNHLHNRFAGLSSQRWVGTAEIFGIIILLGLNFWLLRSFFGEPDRVNVFSAPLIPVLTNLTDIFVSYAWGVRVWLLVFMIFLPLSFYFFVKELSGRRLMGFFSALIASLSVWVFLPIRVSLGLLAQDGAHIASLTLIPLVCLALLKFLRKGNFWFGILSASGFTLVALTSVIGSMILLVFATVITFSEMLLGQGRLKGVRTLLVFVLAAGFSAFWYNPKFVILTLQSPQGQLIKNILTNLLPVSFFLIPLLGIFGFLLFENRAHLQALFIALFLAVILGLFSLGAGLSNPSPARFVPAFGLAMAFLLGILVVWLFDFLRFSPSLERVRFLAACRSWLGFGFLGLVISLILLMFLSGASLANQETQLLVALSEDKKVGIWELKERPSLLGNVFGYLITGLTLVFVGFIRKKLEKL